MKICIWAPEEYQYPAAFGFVPNLSLYLHDDGRQRPGVLVVPGGAYCMVSPSEGEIVAKTFYRMGYQAFVLTYTTNPALVQPLRNQPMRDLLRAVRLIRQKAEAFRVLPDRLAVCGFSAGGHLCACAAVHEADVPEENPAFMGFSGRPDAMILGYSLITLSSCGEDEGIDALLGPHPDRETLRYYSPEQYVTEETPPCFLWHTAGDTRVPVSHSLEMAGALHRAGVPCALHVFSRGEHGMSVATPEWERGEFGSTDSYEQAFRTAEAVAAGEIAASERAKTLRRFLPETGDGGAHRRSCGASREVACWPQMAQAWLSECFAYGGDTGV